ncbi:LysR family transcriptional regulator [Bifidobacterium platyrrhinorum]|uniref:LysR family transcriptional regulator n=1 Tax=Bifidobacterium platyrrhinorum TaxID=2661628 RepID=UPI00298C4230|nr:LysR family transcriptional regulator [Bifidobacterium platyrrhinorum]
MTEGGTMELRVLKYFLAVAEEGNITWAAQLLRISQPTLSRQLKQLEEELGVTLFERGPHAITLTEEGRLLRDRAQTIVSLANKTEVDLKRSAGELSGDITAGCGEVGACRIWRGAWPNSVRPIRRCGSMWSARRPT